MVEKLLVLNPDNGNTNIILTPIEFIICPFPIGTDRMCLSIVERQFEKYVKSSQSVTRSTKEYTFFLYSISLPILVRQIENFLLMMNPFAFA